MILCCDLKYKMQKSILIEAGSSKIYLYTKRQLLKQVKELMWERKYVYTLSTNSFTAGSSLWVLPRSTHNEFYFLFWLKYPFKISSSTFALNWARLFFPYYLHLPTVFLSHVQIWLHLLSVSIVNLSHSFLISYKCSILLPVVFLCYKYPSSGTFVAAALIFFNLLSHFLPSQP